MLQAQHAYVMLNAAMIHWALLFHAATARTLPLATPLATPLLAPPLVTPLAHHNANIFTTCCSIFVATTNHAAFGIKRKAHTPNHSPSNSPSLDAMCYIDLIMRYACGLFSRSRICVFFIIMCACFGGFVCLIGA